MTEFRYRKSQQNLIWSPFFLAITSPHAHGDLDGSIISYSSNVSISFLHASDLCGVMRLAPSLCGTAFSSSSISCSTKLQHPMSALYFEKTSSFRSSTSLMASRCSSVIVPLKCSISGGTVYRSAFPLVLAVPENSNSSEVHRLSLTRVILQDLVNLLFSSIVSRYKFCPYDWDNQQTQFVLNFQSFHIEF